MRFVVVGGCALAGSRARRWTLVWSCALVSAAGALPWMVLSAECDRRTRDASRRCAQPTPRRCGRRVGGLGSLTLARPVQTGATAAVGALAVVALAVSGYRNSRSRARLTIRLAAVAAVLLAGLGVAGATGFGLQQRTELATAVDLTRQGVEEASAGDAPQASATFEEAAAAFDSIADAGDVWWLTPARATPLVGANVEFARTVATAGRELNDVATTLSSVVDADTLRSPEGGVDLAAVEALDEPVTSAKRELSAVDDAVAAADSPWLVGPVASGRDELVTELDPPMTPPRSPPWSWTGFRTFSGDPAPVATSCCSATLQTRATSAGTSGTGPSSEAADGRLELIEVGQPYDLLGPRHHTDADSHCRRLPAIPRRAPTTGLPPTGGHPTSPRWPAWPPSCSHRR